MENKDLESRLIQMCEGIAAINTKIDTMQKDIEDLKKLSTKVTNHANRLDAVDISLQRGEQRFIKIDAKLDAYDKRLDELEQGDGKRAKEILSRVGSYFLTVILTLIVTAVGTYLKSK